MVTLDLVLNVVFIALVQGSILALVSFAITIIFRTSNTTNFAQGMISTFSAFFFTFVFFNLFVKFDPASFEIGNSNYGMQSLYAIISLVMSMIIAFCIGLFLDSVIFRFSKFSHPANKQMITLGVVLLISGLIPVIFGNVFDWTPPKLIVFEQSYNWDINFADVSVKVLPHNMVTILICAAILLALFITLKVSKWGLGVRSTAANEKVAGLMGINTRFITSVSWAIAAMIGGIGAILYSPLVQSVNQGLMVMMQVDGFLAGIAGGFSTFGGPVFAGYLIPMIRGIFTIIPQIPSIWADVLLYCTVLIVVLIKPSGVFGKKTQKKV